MRQWLRAHLTYSNVMATLAVFLVLGGGTALGAFVVSKNSQIAPNTIYGHNAPGKNKNIVASSVTGTDIREATLGKVPNADKLDGIDDSQLEGALAYALGGWAPCTGSPVVVCTVDRAKGVAYVVQVAEGTYCVGVNGISAADPKSVAFVSTEWSRTNVLAQPRTKASWRSQNSACASQEFEVL